MTITQDPPTRPPIPEPYPEPYPKAPDVPFEKILWRVDSEPYDRDGGHVARYVPYIDAREAANVLDDWVGPDRWECAYAEATLLGTGVLWANLTIDFPTGRSVTRRDVGIKPGGSDDNVTIKGIVSDAFKRAAAAFGVGRNVYQLPVVWAKCDVDRRGKARPGKDAPKEIKKALSRLGIEMDVVVDQAPHEETPHTPASQPGPSAQQIVNASKMDVWRLYGVDADDKPFDGAKRRAADLWSRAFEVAVTGHGVPSDLGSFSEDDRGALVEIAERLLAFEEPHSEAIRHAAEAADDPNMTAPFETGDEA